jgi:peptidylprolyl isomerase
MSSRRVVTVIVGLAASASLVLAACGQQTDERASTDTAEVSEAPAEVPMEEVEPPADAAAPVDAPFVTMDCVSLQAMPVDAPPADAATVEAASAIFQPNGAPAITIATGAAPATTLGIADIREGDGAEVQPGDTVTVNYCGVGYGGLTVFDSSWSRGEPISFPLSNLIPGWQEGIPGMKVGGQRLLVIPGALGYGENGAPGIAPNETLVFVIELLDTAS